MTHALASGEGTLGALLYDESLYSEHSWHGEAASIAWWPACNRAKEPQASCLKDPALYDELKQSSTQLRILVTNLNAGKGTAGKLLTDDAAHAKVRRPLWTV